VINDETNHRLKLVQLFNNTKTPKNNWQILPYSGVNQK